MNVNDKPVVELSSGNLDAVIFDMDGVVTRTASVHAAAWKRLFDDLLAARTPPGESFQPFDIGTDYARYVDGKPRYDGVADFLASRGITLPYGSPSDPPEEASVCGLGNRKDVYFWQLAEEGGVEAFQSTVELIRRLKAAGIKVGVFSASKNAQAVLSAANVRDLFDEKVDGVDAEELDIPGKPHPAMLLELARRLGTEPNKTAVVEDAMAGVRAGRDGGFALVIGVNRSPTPGRLIESGANIEVADLGEIGLAAG